MIKMRSKVEGERQVSRWPKWSAPSLRVSSTIEMLGKTEQKIEQMRSVMVHSWNSKDRETVAKNLRPTWAVQGDPVQKK